MCTTALGSGSYEASSSNAAATAICDISFKTEAPSFLFPFSATMTRSEPSFAEAAIVDYLIGNRRYPGAKARLSALKSLTEIQIVNDWNRA